MWHEILPSALIIIAGTGLPGLALYHLHHAVLGNHHRRSLLTKWDRMSYLRDGRVSGDPYVVKGLESLPD